MDTQEFLNSPGSTVSLSAVLVILMRMVKATPIPNWLIPWIAGVCGVIGQCLMTGWNIESVLQGLLAGGGAVYAQNIYHETKYRGADGVPGTGDTDFLKKP